jgi:hypothetical protein
MAKNPEQEPKKVEIEVETETAQGQETEFSTEFNAADEQKAKQGRPDKKDDRGNHR